MDGIFEILDRFKIIDVTYALVLFLVGWSLISWLKRRLPRVLARLKVDDTLKPFISGLVIMGLKLLLGIAVIQKLGIETTSIIAVLGAASLAIGLAFQGTLSNFASGVMLLTLRPFRAGDFIEAAGFAGTVEGVAIFNTTLVTSDNKVAIIPNSMLFNGTILNYSIKPTRRLDIPLAVTYSTSMDLVKSILMALAQQKEQILKDPMPQVIATGHTPNGMAVMLRFWVKSDDYWSTQYELIEEIKALFNQHGIEIPYPHMTLVNPKDQHSDNLTRSNQ